MFDGGTVVRHHYDADGNLTGSTVVESAWDETSRAEALEADTVFCSCGCGQPVELARDPDAVWVVEQVVCYARRARERVERQYRKKHEKSPEGHDDHIVGWYARPFDPEVDKDKTKGRSVQRPRHTPQENGRPRTMRR